MITLRYATIADLSAINDIYNHFILNSAITFDVEPWDLTRRTQWFEEMVHRADSVLLVACDGDSTIGFAYNSPYNDKAAFNRSTEITIYKAIDCTIKGVGKNLYQRLFTELKQKQFHRAYALITVPNIASFKLHQQLGFKQVGVLSEVGEKMGKHHDVALFEKNL